jgi:hypothetical protein
MLKHASGKTCFIDASGKKSKPTLIDRHLIYNYLLAVCPACAFLDPIRNC